jgi:hypothetical protein
MRHKNVFSYNGGQMGDKRSGYDRRQVLKYVMIGGVATAVVMPSKWAKPVVNAVIPPAHAAASAPATTNTAAPKSAATSGGTSGGTIVNTPTGGTVTVTNNSTGTVTVTLPNNSGVLTGKSVTYGGATFTYPY